MDGKVIISSKTIEKIGKKKFLGSKMFKKNTGKDKVRIKHRSLKKL